MCILSENLMNVEGQCKRSHLQIVEFVGFFVWLCFHFLVFFLDLAYCRGEGIKGILAGVQEQRYRQNIMGGKA